MKRMIWLFLIVNVFMWSAVVFSCVAFVFTNSDVANRTRCRTMSERASANASYDALVKNAQYKINNYTSGAEHTEDGVLFFIADDITQDLKSWTLMEQKAADAEVSIARAHADAQVSNQTKDIDCEQEDAHIVHMKKIQTHLFVEKERMFTNVARTTFDNREACAKSIERWAPFIFTLDYDYDETRNRCEVNDLLSIMHALEQVKDYEARVQTALYFIDPSRSDTADEL